MEPSTSYSHFASSTLKCPTIDDECGKLTEWDGLIRGVSPAAIILSMAALGSFNVLLALTLMPLDSLNCMICSEGSSEGMTGMSSVGYGSRCWQEARLVLRHELVKMLRRDEVFRHLHLCSCFNLH